MMAGLRFITKLEDNQYRSLGLYQGNEPLTKFLDRLSEIPSTITTNDAYRLATNWLAALDINTIRLEKEKPVLVEQESYSAGKPHPVPLPLFDINWGGGGVDESGHAIPCHVHVLLFGDWSAI